MQNSIKIENNYKMVAYWKGRRYKLERTENLEEVLLALGVNYILRKLAMSVVPVVELVEDGDYYLFKQYTIIRNREVRFKPGEEFIEDCPGMILLSNIIHNILSQN